MTEREKRRKGEMCVLLKKKKGASALRCPLKQSGSYQKTVINKKQKDMCQQPE